jgi:Ca-activated chloride channel homolog
MYRMTLGCWAKRWTAAALVLSATAFLTAAPMIAQATGSQAGGGQTGSAPATTGSPATLKMPPASTPALSGQATGQNGQSGSSGQTTAPVLTTPSAQGNQGQQEATPVGKDDAGQYVIRRTVNEVNLVFTVTDKGGHFVRNLKQTDFELLDARKPPEKILRFEQQTNLPLRIGILIDTSSSIHSRFSFEQSSAIDFLQSVLKPQRDLAFVMGFDTTPDLTQGYTSNVDKLAQGIHGLKSNGGTALYDAVYKACRDELLPEKSNELVRKAIVLLSDGHDNQSHVREDEAVKMCQRAETIIYTISTNISPSKDTGDETLARLSDQTGGRSFVPIRDEDVAHAFLQIEDELRSQYALEYRPADFKTNGEFRAIWLVPVNRKYQVRAKKGYFAPK